MGFKSTALLLLAAFATTNAIHSFIPNGMEAIYEYRGLIKAGTHLPTSFASSFILEGMLHIQSDANSTIMRLADLKYKMCNGKFDEWHEFEGKMLPLPAELDDLQKNFRVIYDTTGKVMGIATDEKEEQYTINIKRGIAAHIQLDMEQLTAHSSERPYAFHNVENTVYGLAKTYYNVIPQDNNILIEKMCEPHSTLHMYRHIMSNMEVEWGNSKFDEPLTMDSQKNYKLVKKGDTTILANIEGTSGIYFHPFQAQSEAYHIWMNQTFEFVSMEGVKIQMLMDGEKYHNGLDYHMDNLADLSRPLPDITNGRRKWSMDALMPVIEKMMQEVMEYIKVNHINTETPDVKQGQLINRLTRLMHYLDLPHLQKMYENLVQKTDDLSKDCLHIYFHMLPLMGTHPAYKQIMFLVKEKKVKDVLAIEMLEMMPFNVKYPTKELLDDCAQMLEWRTEVSSDVRRAAILSFSTLIHKAIQKHEQYTNIHLQQDGKRNMMPIVQNLDLYPGEEYYKKYVDLLFTELMQSTEEDMRNVYLFAMHNTRMQHIKDLLMPGKKGDLWSTDFKTLMTSIALSPVALRDEDMVMELYYPIMTNTKLSTAVRIAAYYLIMESQPTIARLINIYWMMQSDDNIILYQFHYKYLLTVSEMTTVNSDFRLRLKQVLLYTQRPEQYSLTGIYNIDYMDTKYGFGQGINWMFVEAPFESEKIFKISMSHKINGLMVTPYTFMLRLEGMEGSFFDDLKLDLKSPNQLFTMDTLMKIYANIPNNNNFKLTFIMGQHDQIVMVRNFDNKNMLQLIEFMKFWQGEKEVSHVDRYFHINYPLSSTILLPTEMGFPATLQKYFPKVYYFDYKMTKEVVNKMITYRFDNRLKVWAHGRIGLSFYNSITDMWQGVNKYHSYDQVVPMYMDLIFNPQQNSMRLSLKRHGNDLDILGLRSHVTTMVFIKDDLKHDLLKQSNPKCENFVVVTHGDKFRHDYTLMDQDDSNTGYRKLLKIFDSERYVSNKSLHQLHNMIEMRSDEHFQTTIGKSLLRHMHLNLYMFFQPTANTNGVMSLYEPSKAHPVTNIDISMRLNAEYKKGELFLWPGVKYNMRATYAIKNQEKSVKTWDMNAILDMSEGHKVNTMKMQMTRLIPGQKDFKVCMDGIKKWTLEGYQGKLNIGMSQSAEGKCMPEDTIMDINVTAERSEEQKENKLMYEECQEMMWSDIHEQQSIECYMAHSSLRKYTYDVKMQNIPKYFHNTWKYWFDWVKHTYMPYYSFVDEPTIQLEADNLKLLLDFPMNGKVADLRLYTPQNLYKFTGIPMNKWVPFSPQPENLNYNRLFKFMHYVGLTDGCLIHDDLYYGRKWEETKFTLPTEWTMFLGNVETDAKHGAWAKKIEGTDKIAVRFMHDAHMLEIIPNGKIYDFIVDGQKLTGDVAYHTEAWFHYDWIEETNVVAIMTHHFGLHMLYDGHHLQIEYPRVDMQYHGKCMTA